MFPRKRDLGDIVPRLKSGIIISKPQIRRQYDSDLLAAIHRFKPGDHAPALPCLDLSKNHESAAFRDHVDLTAAPVIVPRKYLMTALLKQSAHGVLAQPALRLIIALIHVSHAVRSTS